MIDLIHLGACLLSRHQPVYNLSTNHQASRYINNFNIHDGYFLYFFNLHVSCMLY